MRIWSKIGFIDSILVLLCTVESSVSTIKQGAFVTDLPDPVLTINTNTTEKQRVRILFQHLLTPFGYRS